MYCTIGRSSIPNHTVANIFNANILNEISEKDLMMIQDGLRRSNMPASRNRTVFCLLAFALILSCSTFTNKTSQSTQPQNLTLERFPSNPSRTTDLIPALWPWEVIPPVIADGRITQVEMMEDRNGDIHVVLAWEDATANRLLYIRRSEGDGSMEWSEPEEIYKDSETNAHDYRLALAIGENGLPQIAWMREYGNYVNIITRQMDGQWSPSTSIGPPTDVSGEITPVALIFDLSNVLHIIWMSHSPFLPYASEWTSTSGLSPLKEIPPPAENKYFISNGGFPVVAMDHKGLLHIAWENLYKMYYSHNTEQGDWTPIVSMGGPCNSDQEMAMVFDAKDTLHMVYSEGYALMYMEKADGDEFPKPVQVPGIKMETNRWRFPRLILVGDGSLFLIWPDSNQAAPYQYLLKKPGEFWSNAASTVPDTASAGSLAATGDVDGFIHLVWGTPRDFRYASESIDNLSQIPGSIAEIPPPPEGTVEFPAGTAGIYQITDYDALNIGSQFIVWSANSGEDKNIYGYDLAAKQEFTVVEDSENQNSPATDGKWIAWEDHRSVSPRIYAWDAETRQVNPLTAYSSPQWDPDIRGEIIVFRDWRRSDKCSWGDTPMMGPSPYCNWDIWGMNLATKEEFPVSAVGGAQYAPKVSDSWVVWNQNLTGSDWAISAKGIGADSAARQLPIGSETSTTGYSLNGRILVYDRQGGKTGQYGIYAYDMVTGQEFPVSIGFGKRGPSVYGNLVVWTDSRNGDADIYGYNLATGREFSVCIAAGNQWMPKIFGDTVAWFDDRNGKTEVYAADLPSLNGGQTNNILPAPTPMPTPQPVATNTFAPTSTPRILPNIPKLLTPANNSVVESLSPLISFDLGPSSAIRGQGFRLIFEPSFETIYIESPGTLWSVRTSINLQPGITYRWKVRPVTDGCDETADSCPYDSNTWSFTVSTNPIRIPSAPIIISPHSQAKVNLNDLLFQWESVEGAMGYIFSAQYDVDFEQRDISYNLIQETSCQLHTPFVDDILEGKLVSWAIRALTEKAWSETAESTVFINP
jgi:beta propeller repeat protein